MKKISCIFLCFCICFLCSCTKRVAVEVPNSPSSQETASDSLKGQPINGTIVQTTEFSEGLAFVKIKEDDDKNYCIDKQGKIVFAIPDLIFNEQLTYGAKTTGFRGGVNLFSDVLGMAFTGACNKEGEVCYASDYDVTQFYPDALEDGYIITFTEGATPKIGVLDLDFEWVIKPSEKVAAKLDILTDNGAQNLAPYYKDKVLYGPSGSLNIESAKLFDTSYEESGKKKQARDPESWVPRGMSYRTEYKDIVYVMASVQDYGKLGKMEYCTAEIEGAGFYKDRAPIVCGNVREWTHFSLIDTQGNVLFEPVAFGKNISYIKVYEGCILVIGGDDNAQTVKMFDINGNFKGELKDVTVDVNTRYYYNDGVIIFKRNSLTAQGVKKEVFFYDSNFRKLF